MTEVTTTTYVHAANAKEFLRVHPSRPQAKLKEPVDLFLIDPPYFGIVKDSWDNQWRNEDAYVGWLLELVEMAAARLKPTGSLILFGGIGKHGSHPLFDLMGRIERGNKLTYRNMIAWKKRRAYGKSHDYLFCREEIVWYTKSPEPKSYTFNIPLLDEKRGYAGFDKKYPAKSEFKRVSNVWADIPELMRPKRNCEKPLPLLRRLIATHSNPGDLVVDFFAGTGSTGVAALQLGRRFVGCEAVVEDAAKADAWCRNPPALGQDEEPLVLDEELEEVLS
jgi:site-specific DNA-methyltransferase (adenine-specific)